MKLHIFFYTCLCCLLLTLAIPSVGFAKEYFTNTAAIKIGVMTIGPGEMFYERFGHNAIVVVDQLHGNAISYNFGYFDPDEPGFLMRFLRGHMRYSLAALPLIEDLEQYGQEGRSVVIQWLHLTPQQAEFIAQRLAVQQRPENAKYPYNYFTSNCTTKVRDLLNTALQGSLQQQFSQQNSKKTYRMQVMADADSVIWMAILIDLGLGKGADQPLSEWQNAFLPSELAHMLASVRTPSGAMLVEHTQQVFSQRFLPATLHIQRLVWYCSALSLCLVLCFVWFAHRGQFPRLFIVLLQLFWLLSGLIGVVLTGLWTCTDHTITWNNANLLLFPPFCLMLLWSIPNFWKVLPPKKWICVWCQITVFCSFSALILYIVSAHPQKNISWVGLVVPVHCAIAYAIKRIGKDKYIF